MKIQEVRNTIFLTLESQLASKNFKYVKGGEGKLIRRFKGGWHEISAPMVVSFPRSYFYLLVSIRLDAIANLYNKLIGALSTAAKISQSPSQTITCKPDGNAAWCGLVFSVVPFDQGVYGSADGVYPQPGRYIASRCRCLGEGVVESASVVTGWHGSD